MKVSCHSKERGMILVAVDDEPWREIHSTIFGRKPALPGTIASFQDLENLFSKQEFLNAKKYSLKRLSQRNYATCELKKLLSEKNISETTIQSVLKELMRLGFCNDRDWIQSFIRQQKAKKVGPQMILLKLKIKGFSEQMIKEVSDQIYDKESQKEGIQRLLKTRYRSCKLNELKPRQKVIAGLLRKGFDFEQISAAIAHERSISTQNSEARSQDSEEDEEF